MVSRAICVTRAKRSSKDHCASRPGDPTTARDGDVGGAVVAETALAGGAAAASDAVDTMSVWEDTAMTPGVETCSSLSVRDRCVD